MYSFLLIDILQISLNSTRGQSNNIQSVSLIKIFLKNKNNMSYIENAQSESII